MPKPGLQFEGVSATVARQELTPGHSLPSKPAVDREKSLRNAREALGSAAELLSPGQESVFLSNPLSPTAADVLPLGWFFFGTI